MNIPDGYFVNGLIFWGKSFSKNCLIAQGYTVEVPDIRTMSTEQACAFHDTLQAFLAELDPSYRLQVQWSLTSDYREDLRVFRKVAPDSKENWGHFVREERYEHFSRRVGEGTLRKERLAIFISHRCNTLPKKGLKSKTEVNHFLEAEKRAFEEKMCRFGTLTGSGRVTAMSEQEHYRYFYSFFNPELPEDTSELGLDPDESILSNCLLGDGVVTQKHGNTALRIGECYHSVLVLRKWPRFVYPGIMAQLMDAAGRDFRITQNIFPLDADKEVKKEEQAIKHLSGNVQSGSMSLGTAIERKHKKIQSLTTGYTMPYKVMTVIRVWDSSTEALASKTMAIKTAIQDMNGAKCHQANHPGQASSLYFESIPGWTGGNRRDWDLYAENHELAALIPVSNSFAGSLGLGESLYEGTNGNLVGVSSFVSGTPQHAVLIGMTGSGKSVATIDFLSQTAGMFDYTAIIEEGLSYGVFTKLMGGQPIIVSPDADLTINYLDTNGLPLSSTHLSVAAQLCLKMIGVSSNEDLNNYRISVIGEYLNALYWNHFEDWKHTHEVLHKQCIEEAYIIEKTIRPSLEAGSSFTDAFKELQTIKKDKPEHYESLRAQLDPEALTAFEKSVTEGIHVRNMASAYYKPEECPTHTHLVEMMRFSKLEGHNPEEIDYLATMLSAWGREGGKGCLFDGVTNFSIDGKITHFELGYIPESAKELKEAAGFLIANFIRQHIIKMSREAKKRIIFEEVSRFLDIPGGDVILSEAYAQLRKYSCWVLCVTQQFSQLKKSSLYKVIMGNSKLFFLMKQNSREDIDAIAESIGLPDTAKEMIQGYTLPEHQKKDHNRCAYMTVYALRGGQNDCGTIKIKPSKELLYVASSDGRTFDQKTKNLAQYDSIMDGVLAEVSKL